MCSAICGPTCAVSPSIACLPHTIRSKSKCSRAAVIVQDVAQVSAPPKALSDTKIPSSAPIARASLKAASACGGPIDKTVTWISGFSSLSLSATSSPDLSSGFIILGTPSLIRVLVTGSSLTSLVSGTCLIHTTIFIYNTPSDYLTPNQPATTIFITSDVPS